MFTPIQLERAKKSIFAQGKTIRQWAKEHELDEITTYRFLSGVIKGRSGESHRVAVALGLKTQV